jgi:hypothetical protein
MKFEWEKFVEYDIFPNLKNLEDDICNQLATNSIGIQRIMNSFQDCANKILECAIDRCRDKVQRPHEPMPFTQDQKDFICYKIGEWYMMMKPLLEGQHNLGHMKERLKNMICETEEL